MNTARDFRVTIEDYAQNGEQAEREIRAIVDEFSDLQLSDQQYYGPQQRAASYLDDQFPLVAALLNALTIILIPVGITWLCLGRLNQTLLVERIKRIE